MMPLCFSGQMLDTTVAATCKANNLLVPCAGVAGCQFNRISVCNITSVSSTDCNYPMDDLNKNLNSGCSLVTGSSCYAPSLVGVYQYMGGTYSSGSSCGLIMAAYCAIGRLLLFYLFIPEIIIIIIITIINSLLLLLLCYCYYY